MLQYLDIARVKQSFTQSKSFYTKTVVITIWKLIVNCRNTPKYTANIHRDVFINLN